MLLLRGLVTSLVVTLVAVVAACGGSAPVPTASPTPSPRGDLPPDWVQHEAVWWALAWGDPHPQSVSWVLTRVSRAAALDQSVLTWLKSQKGRGYVVLVHGAFPRPKTTTLCIVVLGANEHSYCVIGPPFTSLDVSRLPAMHSYVPVLPVRSGVWGYTIGGGGPIPASLPLPDSAVAVYSGPKAAGQPLTRTRSDADGFFALDLEPGVYTFKLATSRRSPAPPTTVTVGGSTPVAVAVSNGAM